jgi:hypothetical protein
MSFLMHHVDLQEFRGWRREVDNLYEHDTINTNFTTLHHRMNSTMIRETGNQNLESTLWTSRYLRNSVGQKERKESLVDPLRRMTPIRR